MMNDEKLDKLLAELAAGDRKMDTEWNLKLIADDAALDRLLTELAAGDKKMADRMADDRAALDKLLANLALSD